MKTEDKPDKANWTPQRARREGVRLMEILCARLDAGESLEDVAIDLDIRAAGGGISERLREVSHEALEIIRMAREEGDNHNDVLAHVRELEKKQTPPTNDMPQIEQGS
jgi:hypothetical protein